jgi:hypothetical protein
MPSSGIGYSPVLLELLALASPRGGTDTLNEIAGRASFCGARGCRSAAGAALPEIPTRRRIDHQLERLHVNAAVRVSDFDTH